MLKDIEDIETRATINAVFGSNCPFAFHIVNTIRESLMVLDGDLKVLVANRAFYRTFEMNKSEVEGRHLFELGAGQWNIPALRELLVDVLPHNVSFEDFEVEYHFSGAGNELRAETQTLSKIMLLNARRLDGDEPGPRILLAFDDITKHKMAEAATQIYIKKLENSNRELQDFAYIASHDLQEPLRAIQAFGERLKVKCGASLSPESQDHLHRMQEAAARMRVLIHDLLAFSRVTSKAQPFSRVDLAQVAQIVVSDLLKRVEECGGGVEIGALPCVEADATQMRQLMQNLIDNALKFHRAEEKPCIRVYEVPANEAADDLGANVPGCAFVVADNGIGFDQKYADRIFTPFQRLHSQRKYKGTGIGLAICRKIVERHHGTISVESLPGRGTTFRIVMPVKQPRLPILGSEIGSVTGGVP